MQFDIRQERKGRDGTHHQVAPGTRGLHGPRSPRIRCVFRSGVAVKPAIARQRGSAQESGDH
eukprot:6954058-Pyramimonas_sp.AAC.1